MGEKMMELFGEYVRAGKNTAQQMIADGVNNLAAAIILDTGREVKISIEIIEEDFFSIEIIEEDF